MNPENQYPEDKEWADMKANWQSTSITDAFMTEKLRLGLRLRMIGSWLGLGLEIAAAILLAVLAAIQLAMGQYGVAAALIVLNVLSAGASVWARRSPLRSAKGSLMELIDLSIHGARRSERFALAQYFMTAMCMVYVIGMYFSNVGDPQAAYHDAGAATVAMVALVLYAGGVAVYHRFARRRGRRFAELRDSFRKPEAGL